MKKNGFTLIELIVVLAIMVTGVTVGFLSLSKYSANRSLDSGLQNLVTVLRDAQRRAVTQQSGTTWGVRFSNAADADTYQIFSGSSYATSSVKDTGYLRGNVRFSEPFVGTSTDIVFLPVSGKVSNKKIISLTTGLRDSVVGDIVIDVLGRTDARFNTGVAGYWHFDEISTSTAYDASGREGNGTVTGASANIESGCKAGKCLSFDGNDYVTIPHSSALDVGNNFSVVAWAKPTALSGTQEVVIKWATGNYWFLRWSGSTLQFTPNADESNARANYSGGTAGVWNHIAGTYDGATAKLYLNGVLAASKSYSGGTNQNSGNVGIGAIVDGTPAQFFTGLIDEVRVYNKTLSASEISDIYEDTK